jgi:hypothetical protein
MHSLKTMSVVIPLAKLDFVACAYTQIETVTVLGYHAMKTNWAWRYTSSDSSPRNSVKADGQNLYHGNRAIPNPGRAPQPAWTCYRRDKCLSITNSNNQTAEMVMIRVLSNNNNCNNNCNNNNNVNYNVNTFVVNSGLKQNIISILVNPVWKLRVIKIKSSVGTRYSGLRILQQTN